MNMLIAAATAAITISTIPLINNVSTDQDRSIYSIVGDGEFNQVMREIPSDPATELRNHTERLRYIEGLLRSVDVSDMPAELQAERSRNLDRLHNYWTRGRYPLNYDHPNAWEPCFIDRDGAICAVGYLVEQSEGRAVAEKINSTYHFATIKEIDAPELDRWIEGSGLTKAEVVTIQGPGLGPDVSLIRGVEPVVVEEEIIAPEKPAVTTTTLRTEELRLTDRPQVSRSLPAMNALRPTLPTIEAVATSQDEPTAEPGIQ